MLVLIMGMLVGMLVMLDLMLVRRLVGMLMRQGVLTMVPVRILDKVTG
jgi:hypothetical protein